MKPTQTATTTLPNSSKGRDLALDVACLLKILTRIEHRRQERLRSIHASGTPNSR